jgi:predicted DNA-binding transcriptional regulator YafY
MTVTFQRVRGITIDREIAPYGLVAKATRWYIIWRARDGGIHVDRASSVVQAVLLEERFVRDETFDLVTYWSQWAARHKANRPAFAVTALVHADLLPSLKSELGMERVAICETLEHGGRLRLQLTFEFLEQARSMLLGFGGAVEVLSPEALRLSIADFGEQTRRVYYER